MVDYTRPDPLGVMPALPHVATIAPVSGVPPRSSNFIEDEVDRLSFEFFDELNPKGAVSRFLVRRAATLAARLDRLARYEAASVASRVRKAKNEFTENRLTEVSHLHSWIAAEPATYSRRLRQSPEGIDRMLQTWQALRDEITDPNYPRWDSNHRHLAENLTGRRDSDLPISPIQIWSAVYFGYPLDYAEIAKPKLQGLDPAAQKDLARDKLIAIIDSQIAELIEERAALDLEAIERDRLEANERAIFDASPTGNQARRYEVATEKGLFQALRMIAKLEKSNQPEAEVAYQPEAEAEAEADLTPPETSPEPKSEPIIRIIKPGTFADSSTRLAPTNPATEEG